MKDLRNTGLNQGNPAQRSGGCGSRLRLLDKATGEEYGFLGNVQDIGAATVVVLDKERWQIGLFFRWIKAHRKVKSLWVYLPAALSSPETARGRSILQILRFVQINLSERRDSAGSFAGRK